MKIKTGNIVKIGQALKFVCAEISTFTVCCYTLIAFSVYLILEQKQKWQMIMMPKKEQGGEKRGGRKERKKGEFD